MTQNRQKVFRDLFTGLQAFAATPSAGRFVPSESGVYAFFRRLDFDPDGLANQLDEFVKRVSFKPKADFTELPARVGIDLRQAPKRLRGDVLNAIEDGSGGYARELADALFECAVLQKPWYVGTAQNLRSRFEQHLEEGGVVHRAAPDAESSYRNKQFLYVCRTTPPDIAEELESVLLQIIEPEGNTQFA